MTSDTLIDNFRLENSDPWSKEVRSIYWDSTKEGWVVTKFSEVSFVLRNKRFGVTPLFIEAPSTLVNTRPQIYLEILNNWMVFQDPPEHSRIRGVLQKSFSENHLELKRLEIESIAKKTIDCVKTNREIELFKDFALPFPASVIGSLFSEDKKKIRKIIEFSTKLPKVILNEEKEKSVEALEEISSLFNELIQETKKHPNNSIINVMIQGGPKHTPLTDIEILSTLVLILVAGYETSTASIVNGMFLLIKNRPLMTVLRNNEAQIKPTIEEFLRLDGPVDQVFRVVLDDIEIDGNTLKKGERVFLSLYTSGYDKEAFLNPNQINIKRENRKSHLAFGKGVHLCIGAPLARIITDVAIKILLQTYKNFELSGEAASWGPNDTPKNTSVFPLQVSTG